MSYDPKYLPPGSEAEIYFRRMNEPYHREQAKKLEERAKERKRYEERNTAQKLLRLNDESFQKLELTVGGAERVASLGKSIADERETVFIWLGFPIGSLLFFGVLLWTPLAKHFLAALGIELLVVVLFYVRYRVRSAPFRAELERLKTYYKDRLKEMK